MDSRWPDALASKGKTTQHLASRVKSYPNELALEDGGDPAGDR